MDIIDAVVAGLRSGEAYGRRIGLRGAWGMRFPAVSGTGFHVILAGDGWLTTRDGTPTAVHPGDVVLVPHGAEHALCHVPAGPEGLPDFTQAGDLAGPAPDFAFFCGLYRRHRAPTHPFLARMPDLVVMRPEGDHTDLRGGDSPAPNGSSTRGAATARWRPTWLPAFPMRRSSGPTTRPMRSPMRSSAILTAARSTG